jgi:hypothetical protein
MYDRFANWANKCGGTFLQLERLVIMGEQILEVELNDCK